MNRFYKITLFGLVFFAVHFVSAQTFTNENEEDTDTDNSRIVKFTSNEIFRSLGIINSENAARSSSLQGNKVLLRQIGDFNQLNVATATRASDISVVQQGNDNQTSLDYTTQTAFARLAQFGNGNTIRDYVYNPQEDISLELTQEGDNIYFERFGANSMTKSLTLKQTEASPVIIIRSFN